MCGRDRTGGSSRRRRRVANRSRQVHPRGEYIVDPDFRARSVGQMIGRFALTRMLSSARNSTMPPMRSAVLLACSAAFVFNVHADDRWVCSPSSDGTGWQCSGTGTLPTPADPPAPTRLLPPPKLPAAKAAAITLDWVPRSELPASRLSVLPEYCDGAYVEPAFPAAAERRTAKRCRCTQQAQQLQYWVAGPRGLERVGRSDSRQSIVDRERTRRITRPSRR